MDITGLLLLLQILLLLLQLLVLLTQVCLIGSFHAFTAGRSAPETFYVATKPVWISGVCFFTVQMPFLL